jgi:indole-3-acetate monooxygenase
LRLAATHAASTAAEIAAVAFRLGGGTAIYDRSPLQRRFRDANVANAHMLVAPATLELTGRLVLGLETDATQL